MSAAIQKKICLLGDIAVGKTSLVRRFVDNFFDEHYLSTIGVTISRKEMTLDNVAPLVRFLIWDLAGEERFSLLQTSYLQGTAGALIVCDLTRIVTSSQSALEKYVERLREVSPKSSFILVGNKIDLIPKHNVAYHDQELSLLSEKLGGPYLVTSAKTGEGVENAFTSLAKTLVSG